MLFRKKLPRDCAYCTYSTSLDSEYVLCAKKGIRSCEKPCGRFLYDPLKRIPPKQKPLELSDFDAVDFDLT